LSSRNVYLGAAERVRALTLSKAVREAEALFASGERRAERFVAAAREAFAAAPEIRVDYVAVVDWPTLEPVEIAGPGSLFAVAAWVGNTRLIDNAILG
jgi:pantothenate synthetase